MTKQCSKEAASCWHRGTALSGLLLGTSISTKHLVNQPFWTNVLHVHFEAGVPYEWNVQLCALLGVEAALDAVIHESHETCCYNDTR